MATITVAASLLGLPTAASSPFAGPAEPSLLPAPATFLDLQFGGQGSISGTTKIKGEGGTDLPTQARVSLLRQRDKLLARQTWSDPVTGAFEFSGIDTGVAYVALAEYPANPADPAAENYLRPVAGVSPLQVTS